jgi:hypothetical protein
MKIFLLITGLLLSAPLFAEDIVVFAKGDSLELGTTTATPGPTDPAKAAFLAAFRADLAQPSAFDSPYSLSDLPEYGRKVPGAAGVIQYHDSFQGGLVIGVTLQGLVPNHNYILTINGNPTRAGNDNLPEEVPQNTKEKYYDFRTITTDANGGYKATFGIRLPAGPYDVRFYVKDTTDFKIVLYHDFFKFTVD